MENNKSYTDIIQQLVDINEKLIKNQISIDVAKQIATNTQVIINAAKVELEFLKYAGIKESELFKKQNILQSLIIQESNKRIDKSCENCKDKYICIDIKRCKDDNLEYFTLKIK